MPDVAVIGGGLIGLAIAWRLRARDLAVCVLDPAPASGASMAAAGMLAPVTEVHYGEERLLALNLHAAGCWPRFADELEEASGAHCGYRAIGTLAVGFDADDRAVLDDLASYQRSLHLDVEVMSAKECRQMEPLLSPQVRGGLHVKGDHSVDNRRVLGCLLEACRRAGVEVRRSRVSSLRTAAGRVTGVQLTDGSVIGSDVVVLAAGCESGALEGVPGAMLPPVRPVKGQILRLRVPAAYQAGFLDHTVRGVMRGRSVYLVTRADGEVVVGATVEEQGFDTRVTAGAVYELLRSASILVPMVSELQFAEAMAGLRPGTPDNAPVLGPSGLNGLVLATGHYRNGVLLTPITADAVAEYVLTGMLPEVAAAFTLARFAHEVPT